MCVVKNKVKMQSSKKIFKNNSFRNLSTKEFSPNKKSILVSISVQATQNITPPLEKENFFDVLEKKLEKCITQQCVISLRTQYFYDRKIRNFFEQKFAIKQQSLPSCVEKV